MPLTDLTKEEQAKVDELVACLRRAGARQSQIDQAVSNKHLELESLRRPRSERALGAGAFVTSGKKWTSPDSVRYFSQTVEERKAEDARVEAERDPNFLRKEISAEYRRLSAEGGDPGKLQALLRKKRAG